MKINRWSHFGVIPRQYRRTDSWMDPRRACLVRIPAQCYLKRWYSWQHPQSTPYTLRLTDTGYDPEKVCCMCSLSLFRPAIGNLTDCHVPRRHSIVILACQVGSVHVQVTWYKSAQLRANLRRQPANGNHSKRHFRGSNMAPGPLGRTYFINQDFAYFVSKRMNCK